MELNESKLGEKNRNNDKKHKTNLSLTNKIKVGITHLIGDWKEDKNHLQLLAVDCHLVSTSSLSIEKQQT